MHADLLRTYLHADLWVHNFCLEKMFAEMSVLIYIYVGN